MQRKKKQVFRVCGRRCGQARFCGSFSTDRFPPRATVSRTSGISLSGKWMSHLSSQTLRVAEGWLKIVPALPFYRNIPQSQGRTFRRCPVSPPPALSNPAGTRKRDPAGILQAQTADLRRQTLTPAAAMANTNQKIHITLG